VGLYGRPRPVRCAHMPGNALTPQHRATTLAPTEVDAYATTKWLDTLVHCLCLSPTQSFMVARRPQLEYPAIVQGVSHTFDENAWPACPWEQARPGLLN
jgi:hypothetical protein